MSYPVNGQRWITYSAQSLEHDEVLELVAFHDRVNKNSKTSINGYGVISSGGKIQYTTFFKKRFYFQVACISNMELKPTTPRYSRMLYGLNQPGAPISVRKQLAHTAGLVDGTWDS